MNVLERSEVIDSSIKPNFIELAIRFLDDNRLSADEKNQLNQLIGNYENECNQVQNECKISINEIKSEIELKRIISETNDYKNTVEEFSKLTRQEIRNIQQIVGTSSDGIFGINSYIAYKNSPISGVFNPSEIANGRRVGENIKGFIENFSRLNGVDTEIMAIILSDNIGSDSFIILGEDGNITVFNNNKELITFSESISLEGLLHDSFIKKDLSIITKQLSLIPKDEDKINYILTLKNIIENYNYQSEARQIFTKNTSKGVEISLPETSLNRDMKAVDLFGDYRELIINGEKYINSGDEFFTESGKRLAIFNRQVLNIENLNNKIPNELEHNLNANINQETENNNTNIESINENLDRNLSREFGNWLTTEGSKLLGRTGPNSCGTAVSLLINTFMRSKGIRNALNINTARNGTNFNSILEQGNITSKNPFVIKSGRNIYKITSESDLRRNGLDIRNILNQRLKVNSRNIDFPKESVAGEIIVFNEGAESTKATRERKSFGHVEVKGSDNMYYSYYKSRNPGGSTPENESGDPREYARLTGFTGKAYRIEMNA